MTISPEGAPKGGFFNTIKRALGFNPASSAPLPTSDLPTSPSQEAPVITPPNVNTQPKVDYNVDIDLESQRLLAELEERGRKGRLVIMVGTSADIKFRPHLEQSNDTVVSKPLSSQQAINIFQKVRPEARRSPIVLIVDDQPGLDTDPSGIETANQLLSYARKGELRPPMLAVMQTGENVISRGSLFNSFGILSLGVFRDNPRGLTDFLSALKTKLERQAPRSSNLPFETVDQMAQAMQESQATRVRSALQELSQIEGKKGFILIADDTDSKIKACQKNLEEHAQETSEGYVIRSVKDGISATAFFREFRKQAPTEKIIMVLDGNFDSNDRMSCGLDIADYVMEAAKRNKWEPPLLVGESSDRGSNQELADYYPRVYLGDIYHNLKPTLEAIDSKL